MGSRGSCERGLTGNLYMSIIHRSPGRRWLSNLLQWLPDMKLGLRSFPWPCSPIIIDHCIDHGLHILLYIFLVPKDEDMIRIALQVKLEPVKPWPKPACNQDSETVWHLRHGNASQRRTKPPPDSRLLFSQTHLALWCMIWMYHDVSHQASIKTGASYNRGLWLICQIPSLQWSRDPSFAQHVLGDTSLPDCFILAAKKTHCTRKS